MTRTWTVPCPYCNEDRNQPCRTLKTRRVAETHRARIDAFWEAVDEARAKRVREALERCS